MSIRRLSVQLANQIAAGEVVERPASVVKELLENAVDAGSRCVVCAVENAGRTLIRVQDDGVGIVYEDLPLVFAAHATSKISTISDLDAITTLGFRGEALASIASVSKICLTSKANDSQLAFSVSCSGDPAKIEIMPAAHPQGTSVEVRELFFNTPARRRFLRSDRTELMRIKDVFVRCAVANPQLAFSLVSDGRTILEVGAGSESNEDLRKRLGRLIGGEFINTTLSVNYRSELLNIQGLCLPPPLEHETIPEQIYLFLNGRPIADKLLTHALKDAYAAASGRRSVVRCVLYLSCKPSQVDVNVHPCKDEVRFHEARLIHDTLADAILGALGGGELQKLGSDGDEESSASGYLQFIREQQGQQADEGESAFPDGQSSFISLSSPESESTKEISAGKQPESTAQPQSNVFLNQASSDLFLNKVAAENAVLKATIKGVQARAEILESLGDERYFVRQGHEYYVVDKLQFARVLKLEQYAKTVNSGSVATCNLPIPVAVKLSEGKPPKADFLKEVFIRCGFCVEFSRNTLVIKSVPVLFRQSSLPILSSRLLTNFASHGEKILALSCQSICFVGTEDLVEVENVSGMAELLEIAASLEVYEAHKSALVHIRPQMLSAFLSGCQI